MLTSIQTGRASAGVKDGVIATHDRIGLPPVVYLHAVNGTAASPIRQPEPMAILNAVNAAGFTVVIPTINSTWGIGATFAARMAEILAWARSAWGCSAEDPALIGQSHGGGAGINYMANNPGGVACYVGVLPAIDYQAIRVANPADPAGLRASIDAAAGVVYPTALPAGTDPATRTAGITGIPQQLWADTTTPDPVSVNIATYASAVGAELHTAGLNHGHSEATIAQIDIAAVVAFIREHTT